MKNILRAISIILCTVMVFSMSVYAKMTDAPEALIEEMRQNMDDEVLYKFGSRTLEVERLRLVEYYGEFGGYHIGVFFPDDSLVLTVVGETVIGGYKFTFPYEAYIANLFAYKDGGFIFHSEKDISTLLTKEEMAELARAAGASLVNSPADKLTDVNYNSWYGESVRFCVENGIMSGVGNDKFDPAGNFTRAQMVQILFNISGEDVEEYKGESGFEDVGVNSWCAPAVNWAKKTGITAGVTETEFQPNRDIPRQEMIRMFYVYAEHLGYDMRELDDLSAYEDKGYIAPWAYTETQWAVAKGLISGVTESKIDPRATANRAQASRLLMQFSEFLKNTEPMDRKGAYEVLKNAVLAGGQEDSFGDYRYYFDPTDFTYCVVYEPESEIIRFEFGEYRNSISVGDFEYASVEVYCLSECYNYHYSYDDCILAEGIVGNGSYTESLFEYNGNDFLIETEEEARELEKNTRAALILFMDNVLTSLGIEPEEFFITE
ncbi:MAG: S-layer homology domain-containing protein [Clostridia bacterium]|nr:S-layer homology domain-containing protein [Clostridia bacterium]